MPPGPIALLSLGKALTLLGTLYSSSVSQGSQSMSNRVVVSIKIVFRVLSM